MRLFVPGRVCLLGEHSDWAGGYRRINPQIEKGYTLICGTDQGIHAEVEPHPTALVLTATMPSGRRVGPHEIPMAPEALLEEAARGGFWSYVAGVAYQALTHYQVRGLVLHNDRTDLPIQKGLSSSAAICVLTARAFNRLYDLKLTVRGEMELAYQGEITTPSRCGRMDQGCAFGRRPVLMTFDGDRLDTAAVRVARALHLVIVDLQAHKDTMKILDRLNRCYPVAEDEVARGVQELLGPINKRLVRQAVEALQAGDAQRLGALMTEAQRYFDRYARPACPEELTAPALHRVLAHEALQPHVWGGKGVGSQGDGAAQLVARSAADQQAVLAILQRDLGLAGLALTIRPSARVRKAVIPAAGFGTRLFPATKAVKKALFPIVGPDGMARPALLVLVEEALEAGIEEVIVVVQPEDLEDFRAFFQAQDAPGNYARLPRAAQEYAERILEMGRRVSFILQPLPEGFGHAVHCAREAVGDEPFLLLLGDHLYRATGERSCARQLLDAYDEHGVSIVGLRRAPEEALAHFGTVTGVWIEPDALLRITAFAEKPTPEEARTHLRVPGLPEGEYLTLFGQYILMPQVFDYLAEDIAHNLRERGEFPLTPALERLRREEGFLGLMVAGERYDIGTPAGYVRAVGELGGSWAATSPADTGIFAARPAGTYRTRAAGPRSPRTRRRPARTSAGRQSCRGCR